MILHCFSKLFYFVHYQLDTSKLIKMLLSVKSEDFFLFEEDLTDEIFQPTKHNHGKLLTDEVAILA